jgi:phosphatidylglycerophosphate synthase
VNSGEMAAHGAKRKSPFPPPKRTGRPAEMDDWLNAYVFHPLAQRLARLLVPTPLTPNMVSVAGGLAIVAAALLYTRLDWPLSVALGVLAHASWHVLDGADGDLARMTGRSSPLGEMVDGVCDYFGHIVLYVLLAAYGDRLGWGGWSWTLASFAGASRIFQSNHAEGERRTYLWRGYGIPWLRHAYAARDERLKRGVLSRLFHPLARLYVLLASAGAAADEKIDAAIAKACRSPGGEERARRVCRDTSRLPLKLQTLLGPNLRTLALAISMAVGDPIWFFLWETIPLNLLFAVSAEAQRRADRAIAARLDANRSILGG